MAPQKSAGKKNKMGESAKSSTLSDTIVNQSVNYKRVQEVLQAIRKNCEELDNVRVVSNVQPTARLAFSEISKESDSSEEQPEELEKRRKSRTRRRSKKGKVSKKRSSSKRKRGGKNKKRKM